MRLQVVEKLAYRGALEKYPRRGFRNGLAEINGNSEDRPQKGWAPGARERGEGRIFACIPPR
jgi:hypothetical protein